MSLIQLQDICTKVCSGGTPSTRNKDFYINGVIPWVKTKEVNNNKITEAETYITEEALAKSSAKLIPENSVIVAMYGNGDTAGRVAINKIPVATNQACCNLIIDPEKADYRFVFYYLRTQYQRLVDLKNGGAQQNLNAGMLKEYPFPNIPLEKQAEIAAVLESFDDKIELNRQTNQTLEHIAQAIFKSWFVDFEPTRAKLAAKQAGQDPECAAMAAISGKSVEELDQLSAEQQEQLKTTAALFPDGLQPSVMGEIPLGWSVKQLDEIAQFQNGFAFYTVGYSEEGYKVVDLANISSEGKFIETDRDKRIASDVYDLPKHEKHQLNKDDIVMAMTDMTQAMGILGRCGKIYESNKFILNQRIGRIRAKKGMDVNFLLTNLNSKYQVDFLKNRALGSVQKYVNTSHIKEMEFVVPVDELMRSFGEAVEPIFSSIRRGDVENDQLGELRDRILPKLLSGEIALEPLNES